MSCLKIFLIIFFCLAFNILADEQNQKNNNYETTNLSDIIVMMAGSSKGAAFTDLNYYNYYSVYNFGSIVVRSDYTLKYPCCSEEQAKNIKSEWLYDLVKIRNYITKYMGTLTLYDYIFFLQNPEKYKVILEIIFKENPKCITEIYYECFQSCVLCVPNRVYLEIKQDYIHLKPKKQISENIYSVFIEDEATDFSYFQVEQINAIMDLHSCRVFQKPFDRVYKGDPKNREEYYTKILRQMPNIIQEYSSLLNKNRQDNRYCNCQPTIPNCFLCNRFKTICYLCKDGYYVQNGECRILNKDWLPNCKKAITDAVQNNIRCIECEEGYLIVQKWCFKGPECPEGYAQHYLFEKNICCRKEAIQIEDNENLNYCSFCDESCEKCKPQELNPFVSCVQCSKEYNPIRRNYGIPPYIVNYQGGLAQDYQNDECQLICPVGQVSYQTDYIAEYFNRRCYKCYDQYCQHCNDPFSKGCYKCLPGYILTDEYKCLKCNDSNCPDDQKCKQSEYRQKDYPFRCIRCPEGCSQCESQELCKTCKDKYYLLNDICIEQALIESQFLDEQTKQIYSCNFACLECSDLSHLCKECSPQFSYYIEEEGKKRCYEKCPLNFIKENNDDSSRKCVPKSELNQYIKESSIQQISLRNHCLVFTFWNGQICENCPLNCLHCFSKNSCYQCNGSFYWNSSNQQCESCHQSCKTCRGPLSSDCMTCENLLKTPSENNPCEKQSQTSQIIISVFEIQKLKENFCPPTPPVDQIQYNRKFVQFALNDPRWGDVLSKQISRCEFKDFINKFPYLEQYKNQDCKNSDISQSKFSEDGHLISLLTSILSSEQLLLYGQPINPSTFLSFAYKRQSINTIYKYFKKGKQFNCSDLLCKAEIQIKSLNFGTEYDNISLRKSRKFQFYLKNNVPQSCFTQEFISDFEDLERFNEFEKLVTSAFEKDNYQLKNYFILNICGEYKSTKSFVSFPVLLQKQLGKGFYQVLNPNSSDLKDFTIYIGGASTEQNPKLKNCFNLYENPFTYYKVINAKIYHLKKLKNQQDRNEDVFYSKYKSIFKQYDQIIDPSSPICNCSSPRDLIRLNDKNLFLNHRINSDNTILTPYISLQNLMPVLKKYGLQAQDTQQPLSQFQLPINQLTKLLNEYIDSLNLKVKDCYSLKKINQCVQNVLVDIVYTNNGECLDQTNLSKVLQPDQLSKLLIYLEQSKWCTQFQSRCKTNLQLLRHCLDIF